MLLKCTSWWFLDTNDTPTITAKNNYHCCNNHHCCLIVGFSPLVTCTTFFCCPSKKCHHSAHLVLTYQWQYYIDHCRKRQQNKDTTKATKVHGCFYFLDANTTTTAAKNTKKQGHHQEHNNQHDMAYIMCYAIFRVHIYIYGAICHMYIVLPYFPHTLSTTAVFCYVLCSV